MKKFLASFLKKILIKVESIPSQSLEIKNKKPQKKQDIKII